MAHGITATDGAAYSFKPAWHGLGVTVDHAMTSEEAINIAKLNWQVVKMPMFLGGTTQEVPDIRATVRVDKNEDGTEILTPLGTVSDNYHIVQNVDAFNFLDSFLQDGIMKIEAAFSMYGGRKICITARLPSFDYEVAKDDLVQRFLVLANGHDGLTCFSITNSSIRAVCQNTMNLALQNVEGFKHRILLPEKMEKMKLYLSQFDEQFTLYKEKTQALANVLLTEADITKYLNTLFPPIEEEGYAQTRRDNKIQKIRKSFEESPAQLLPSIRGTAWSLFNAVTENLDHDVRYTAADVPQDKTSRHVDSILWGPKAKSKAEAFDVAMSLV